MYTPIERDVAGQTQLMPSIIRAANRKTFLPRDSSGDQGSPGAGRDESLGGVQSHALALAAVAPGHFNTVTDTRASS